jgi:hypothetical protein
MGSYTSTTKVQGITQFADGAGTTPTTTQITQWITEVEKDVDTRCLASYTLTDQIVDILPELNYPAKGTIAWLEAIGGLAYDEIDTSVFIPPFLPLVSVTSLYRRTSAITETAVWELLTEGPGSSGSFMILKKRTKTNQYLGFCLYFYQNQPDVGLGRVKMTYVYGWNLSSDIIGEWCTLKVALKVFEALKEANTPYGSSDYSLMDLRVGLTDIETRQRGAISRIKELEENYFPSQKLGIAFIK